MVASTVLVYLTRPDAVAIPLVTIAVHYWARDRRPPWRILLLCGLALAAVLGLCQLYFGTPFPLAFYLKSRALTVYTSDFVNMDLALKHRNVLGSLVLSAILLYLVSTGNTQTAWFQVVLVLLAAYTVWIVVAVWRCAFNVRDERLGHIARALTVAWAINAALVLGFLELEYLRALAAP